ncbi:MAG: metal-dependent hydrolase [Bacteroidetes bacterium]|nr:metal-dependent hydrolase [Bacteroidota bacterium]MCL5738523.1 metal-dependent hydrolase [Bacteroidota bacterium]
MKTNGTKTRKFKNGLQIQWLGHAAFKIVSPGGKVIFIDPWLDNPNAPPNAKPVDRADIIILTHGHFDHIGNTVEIALKTNAKVVSNFEISLFLKGKGLQESNLIGMNKSGTVEIDGIKMTMVNAEHSSGITDGDRVVDGGSPAGFIMKFEDGYTIYNTGDTGLFGDMKIIAQLYKPQVVMMCIGGHFTMSPVEAAEAVKLMKPKFVIPMHFGTFPLLSGTPEMLKKLIPKSIKTKVEALKPGEVIE